MTSSNGNIFRVTGPLCWEFTGHWWIPVTKANDAEPWCFLWSAPEQTTNIRGAHYDAVRHALGNKLRWNVNQNMKIFIQENELENIFKTTAIYFYVFMMTSSNGNIFPVTGPLCGEFTGPGEFPTQRPVTRSFDVFFDLRLNKRLSKQPWGW